VSKEKEEDRWNKNIKNNKNGSKDSKEGHLSPIKSSLISLKH
jgi:hypothetical protein